MDKILSALSLCRKAGKVALGAEQVVTAIRAKKARVVLIASDVSANTLKTITDKAVFYGADYETVKYTQMELGRAVGISHCATVAICDDNLAKLYKTAKLKTSEVN
ncbi:MAG: hypothetical protein GX148_05605 [Clostridiales bacterium]|jgi:ribosomal protein L7Ae-like RNA K-turn-binding protein|nr:hypothetical protein [Clostridiales bacterium]